jgi:hypothetical protein
MASTIQSYAGLQSEEEKGPRKIVASGLTLKSVIRMHTVRKGQLDNTRFTRALTESIIISKTPRSEMRRIWGTLKVKLSL